MSLNFLNALSQVRETRYCSKWRDHHLLFQLSTSLFPRFLEIFHSIHLLCKTSGCNDGLLFSFTLTFKRSCERIHCMNIEYNYSLSLPSNQWRNFSVDSLFHSVMAIFELHVIFRSDNCVSTPDCIMLFHCYYCESGNDHQGKSVIAYSYCLPIWIRSSIRRVLRPLSILILSILYLCHFDCFLNRAGREMKWNGEN